MQYELNFLKALALTIGIESIVLLVLNSLTSLTGKQKLWILILTGITASGATLPYFWFIVPLFIKTKLLYALVSEFLAIFIESFIILGFFRISFKRAILVSFTCNAVSYLTGLIIHHFF